MDRQKLLQIAGYYFKDQLGMEPDTLELINEGASVVDFTVRATAGERRFDIWMVPMHDKIRLTEIRHEGSFRQAVELPNY